MHYSHSPPERLLLQALRAITSHPFVFGPRPTGLPTWAASAGRQLRPAPLTMIWTRRQHGYVGLTRPPSAG